MNAAFCISEGQRSYREGYSVASSHIWYKALCVCECVFVCVCAYACVFVYVCVSSSLLKSNWPT